MTFDELQNLVAQGESDTLEFLDGPHTREFYEVICALSNTKGGRIVVGIQEQDGDKPEDVLRDANIRKSWFAGSDPHETNLRISSNVIRGMFSTDHPRVSMITVQWDQRQARYFPIISVEKSTSPVKMADGRYLVRRNGRTILEPEPSAPAQNPKSVTRAVEHTLEVDHEINVENVQRRPAANPDAAVASTGNSLPNNTGDVVVSPATAHLDIDTHPPEVSTSPAPNPPATPGNISGVATMVMGGSASLVGEVNVSPPPQGGTPTPPPIAHGVNIRISRESTLPCLDVKQYASVLARLFSTSGDSEKLSFALLGPWGRGKTYLMNVVAEQLDAENYHVVTFSAWKYRSTPEVWAHLYESIFHKAWASNWLVPIRSNLLRNGIWPAVLQLFGLFLGLLTFGQRAEIASYVVGIFGMIGVLYLLVFYRQTASVASRLQAQYLSVSRHDDKLGLQAAIGRDLEALLIAWIPNGFWSLSSWIAIARGIKRSTELTFGVLVGQAIGVVAYYLVIIGIGCNIFFTFSSVSATEGAVNYGFYRIPTIYLTCAVAFVLTGALALLPPIAVWWNSPKDRLLLVVDDLDRCDQSQLLALTESLMLMLDGKEISSRVQVAMLFEEGALARALKDKYFDMKQSQPDPEFMVRKSPGRPVTAYEVVHDNLEKLFLVYLRLPPLSEREVAELMKSFTGEISEPERSQMPANATPNVAPTVVPLVNAPSLPSVPPRAPLDSPFPLTHYERDLLLAAVGELSKDEKSRVSLGPRQIRCLLFRFQLARMLLQELKKDYNSDELIKCLINGTSKPASFAKSGVDDDAVQWVVHQVL